MDNLVYTLKALARRYETIRIWIPTVVVSILIKRDVLKLRKKIEQSLDLNYINFTSIQGRQDHVDTFFISSLNGVAENVFSEFDQSIISSSSWSVRELKYVTKAIKSATNAIPYYLGGKDIKALTTFHNPELLVLKSLFQTQIHCVTHGIRLKRTNFKRKYPLEAGCDVLKIMYKEDTDEVLEQFNEFNLPKPKIVYQETYNLKQVDPSHRKRVVYLQTIYKNINPVVEIIVLRIRHRHILYKLHPRLSSNVIKRLFFNFLNIALGGRVDDPNYRVDTLYLSNGSTALLNAVKQNCEVAFFSPSKAVKNPYPDYMYIRDYEN